MLPQAREDRSPAEFERFRLLLASNIDGLEKIRFGFALGIRDQGVAIGNLCVLRFAF